MKTNMRGKKLYALLNILGTLTMTSSLITLYASLLTPDWLTLQEPILDPTYDNDPKPHLLKAKLGLFRTCIAFQNKGDCVSFNFRRFLNDLQLFEMRHSDYLDSELVVGCVNRVRLTLPFIISSVFFTSLAFFTLLFGTFCNRNKKIIEASFLILAGLCQATALLTFVSQIGSEFESNNFYPQTSGRTSAPKLSSHYRYKYGYSFYLFLLSFSLSELAALFDMAAYFRKQKKQGMDDNGREQGELLGHHEDHIIQGGGGHTVGTETYGMDTLHKQQHQSSGVHPDICEFQTMSNEFIIPQESYFISPEVVTVVQPPQSFYGTGSRKPHPQSNKLTSLESFATMGRGATSVNGRNMNNHHNNSALNNPLSAPINANEAMNRL